MTPHAPTSLVAPLRRLVAGERRRQAADRDLLRAFAKQGDGDAFTELLHRHGPMVLRLALHLLHHRQDAEDVFQAAFLALARQARGLRGESSVAAWLHRVAWRLAVRSRKASARRCASHPPPPPDESDPAAEISLRETQALLHQELAALPDRLRLPLVLCYLEGLTRDEAAGRLGWSLGTLKRYLERGRKLLHVRLSRRGVTLSAALSTSLLAPEAVSAALAESTRRLALSVAAGSPAALPAPVAALLAEVSLSAKTKALWALALMLAALAGAGAWVAFGPPGQPESPPSKSLPAVDRGAKPPLPARDRFGDPLPPGALARMGTVRFRHGSMIEQISLAPDGRTLATASRDGTVRLWDMATGRELLRLPGHEGPSNWSSLRCVSFSPDGKILATGISPGGVVRLWDAATAKELRKLQSPYGWLGHLAFSADGKTVAASADRHHIVLWEAATGRLLQQLDGGEKLTFAVPLAFAPDGRTLASGGLGETIRLWDLKTGKEAGRFQAQPPRPKDKSEAPWYEGLIHALAFSPDGRTLASAAMHSPVRLWDVAAGKEVLDLRGNPRVACSLAFSPDGQVLAAGDGMRTVRLWEAATGKEIRHIQTDQGYVTGLAFVRGGEVLLTSGDGAIRLWEVRSGAEILPDRGHTSGIVSGVLSADGRTLITGSSDGSVRWWDRATGNERGRLAAPVESLQGGRGMALSPDGALAAYHTEKRVGKDEVHGGIELWDLSARKKLVSLWRPNIFTARFSPDGKTLFTQIWDVEQRYGRIVAWDAATGKELRTLARNPDGFEQILQLSPDGKILAAMTSGLEKSVVLCDAATGKELGRVPANPEFSQCLAISPDNQLLAVADGTRLRPDSRVLHAHIHVYDIASGKEVHRFGRTLRGYGSVVFAADRRTLATADEENQIRLWEVATGGERLRLAGHAGQVGSLFFADNGRTLVSTSSDTTALVWDLTGLRGKMCPSRDLQELWSALAEPDAAAAYRAIWDLTAAPREAVAFLRERLRRMEPPEEKRIAQWVRDLDSPDFAAREHASEELAKLDCLAEPALRKALGGQPSLEMRRRIGQLLERLVAAPSGVPLQQLRAVEVLEHTGTPEARELLESLARGAAGARLTRAAQAALRR